MSANDQTPATSCEELTHWKRLWYWEGLGAGGEGDDRGWDGWMASPTQWMWVWVNSGSWWWTGRPGVLRVIHGVAKSQTRLSDWTELNWIMTDGFIKHATLPTYVLLFVLVVLLLICALQTEGWINSILHESYFFVSLKRRKNMWYV